MRYALPAAAVSLAAYAILGGTSGSATPFGVSSQASPRGLPMLIAPALVIALLLARRHLIEGLLLGNLVACLVGLGAGLLEPSALLHIDAGGFAARGLIVDGIERGVGVSVFTLLLVGLVATLESTGALARLVRLARERARTQVQAELWIFSAVSAAVLLTTHSVVAILAASATATGVAVGMPRVTPLAAGLHNVYSWLLLLGIVGAILTGYGRKTTRER